MKQTQNTRVVSGGRRGGSVLAGERKVIDSHSGEVAACSLARERRLRQSLAHGPVWDKEKTPKPLHVAKLPSASRLA